ncbi:MAG: DUF5688 family protein [Lachnospiraceae bacterium]|nr:DUF5688 family protein [Lachnospiraceae bacterium]
MNYEEFKVTLAEDLEDTLFENGFEDVSIRFNEAKKANETYEAMTVTPGGSNIGVSLNTEAFFNEYKHGMDYEDVLSHVTDIASKAMEQMPVVDVSQLTDYEQMKDKLSVEVISKEANKDLLTNIPHKDMEDMAVIYRFIMDDGPEGMQSITVTNNLMENMGITPEQLHADAIANAPEMRPPVIKGMTEVMKEIMGEEMFAMFGESLQSDGNEMMYVATTPDRINGAGIIAYPEFMEQASEKLEGDFYLLPSSRHEVILVKDDGGMNFEQLQAMVHEVNATEVSATDKLTDNVYHYDSEAKVFELAEDYDERLNSQDLGDDLGESEADKGSVLKELDDKKKEVAERPAKEATEKATKAKGGEAI